MELAELDLLKGDKGDAADIAEKALADPHGDHADATYVLARIDLMDGDPEKASKGFEQTLALSKDPRTVAWSHIYLGRLYDTMDPPDRGKAVAEYKAALATRDSLPDTKQAAESGITSRSCCRSGRSRRTTISRSILRARRRRTRTNLRLRSIAVFRVRFACAGGLRTPE